jgi:hypothetical protein
LRVSTRQQSQRLRRRSRDHQTAGRAGTAEKLFTPRLQTGFYGLHFPGDRKPIVFRFDVEAIPYVKLWVCDGGWPVEHTKKLFTVAWESCNIRSDSLAGASAPGECPMLDAGASRRWTLRSELYNGLPNSKSRPEL